MTTDQLLDRIVSISARYVPPSHQLAACREISDLAFDFAQARCDDAMRKAREAFTGLSEPVGQRAVYGEPVL